MEVSVVCVAADSGSSVNEFPDKTANTILRQTKCYA